jgi:hypothetical protein
VVEHLNLFGHAGFFLLNKFNVGKKEGDSFQFQEDRTKRVRDRSSHRLKTTVMWFSSIAAVEMIGGPAVAVILAGECTPKKKVSCGPITRARTARTNSLIDQIVRGPPTLTEIDFAEVTLAGSEARQ